MWSPSTRKRKDAKGLIVDVQFVGQATRSS
jgi:hypothetical protein